MNDIFLRIEQACQTADSTALLIAGLIATVMGLFLWLGGVRYSWAVAGMLGTGIGIALGSIISYYFTSPPIVSMAVGGIIGAIGAILMQQLIIILIAIVIFSSMGGTGYLTYILDKTGLQQHSEQRQAQDEGSQDRLFSDPGTAGEIAEKIRNEVGIGEISDAALAAEGFWSKIKGLISDIKPAAVDNGGMLLLFCVGGAIIGLVLAQLLKWIIMALCCSIVGATSTIVGVMLLIAAKGNLPFSAVQDKENFLPTIFGVMIIIGWIVQLFIGKPKKKIVKQTVEEE